MRRHYLVTYDISDDKRRTRVFERCKDTGDHTQYSVFTCDLNRTELAALRAQLDGLIHHEEDQILILDLGPAHHPLDAGMECLGRAWKPPITCFIV